MSSIASGAAPAHALDPSLDTHYVIGEDTHHSMQLLCDALTGLGQLGEVPTDEIGPYVEVRYLAAIFHVMAGYTAHLIADATVRFPLQEPREAAELAAAEAAIARMKGGVQ